MLTDCGKMVPLETNDYWPKTGRRRTLVIQHPYDTIRTFICCVQMKLFWSLSWDVSAVIETFFYGNYAVSTITTTISNSADAAAVPAIVVFAGVVALARLLMVRILIFTITINNKCWCKNFELLIFVACRLLPLQLLLLLLQRLDDETATAAGFTNDAAVDVINCTSFYFCCMFWFCRDRCCCGCCCWQLPSQIWLQLFFIMQFLVLFLLPVLLACFRKMQNAFRDNCVKRYGGGGRGFDRSILLRFPDCYQNFWPDAFILISPHGSIILMFYHQNWMLSRRAGRCVNLI